MTRYDELNNKMGELLETERQRYREEVRAELRAEERDKMLRELEVWIKQRRVTDQVLDLTDPANQTKPEDLEPAAKSLDQLVEEVEAVDQLNAHQEDGPDQYKTVPQMILEHVAKHPGRSALEIKKDLKLRSDSSVYRLLYKNKLTKVWVVGRNVPGFYLPEAH